MKKVILFFAIMLSGIIANSQSTFFKYENTMLGSVGRAMIESHGYIYMGGSFGLKAGENFDVYIAKYDQQGTMIEEYNFITDTISKEIFDLKIYNDTILRAFINYIGKPHQEIMVKDFDLDLNFIQSKSYHIIDSALIFASDNIVDKDGNFIITGVIMKHPDYPNFFGFHPFLMKLSPCLDSLNYFETSNEIFMNIQDVPQARQYSISTLGYEIEYYNYNFEYVKTLRIDTFILELGSHLIIDTNKIALIAKKPILQSTDESTVLKIIDTLGNDYNYVDIIKQDTIISPGHARTISMNKKTNKLFFSWIKNRNYMSAYNNYEPSFIGIAKTDFNLNVEWVKYFGNDSFYYEVLDIISTNDGGVLATGSFSSSYGFFDIPRYFILKVDSLGECTFLKEILKPEMQIDIFPNPTSTILNLSFQAQNQSIESIKIINTLGQEVMNKTLKSTKVEIDVSALKTGVYFVEVINKNGEKSSAKFVKK